MTTGPTPGPQVRFRKMHGLGNDFVVIDARTGADPVTPALARVVGDRHRGVGFDQLAVIHGDDTVAARLVFWNADGSTSAACGNATRCIAALLMDEAGTGELTLRTERGLLSCRRRGDGLIEVDMGVPMLGWHQVPLAEVMDTGHLPLDGDPAACSMGNPHCTFFVDDVAAVDLVALGAATERHPLFPERTNVQVVEVTSRGTARVRVWERGVGPTLASGSSSCAVLVNAVRRGLMDRAATLTLDGGDIHIRWPSDDSGVLMAGPVATAFEGVLSPELLAST